MMTLTLPYPPSANRYWRVWRGRAVKSTEARKYQDNVRLMLLRSRHLGPRNFQVRMTVDIYRPAKRGDLDNSLKVIIDALKGIAYKDDSQVVEIHARRFEDKKNPRAVVTVEAVE